MLVGYRLTSMLCCMMHDAIFVVPPRLGGSNALFFLLRKNEMQFACILFDWSRSFPRKPLSKSSGTGFYKTSHECKNALSLSLACRVSTVLLMVFYALGTKRGERRLERNRMVKVLWTKRGVDSGRTVPKRFCCRTHAWCSLHKPTLVY